jgi:hypothetical protein
VIREGFTSSDSPGITHALSPLSEKSSRSHQKFHLSAPNKRCWRHIITLHIGSPPSPCRPLCDKRPITPEMPTHQHMPHFHTRGDRRTGAMGP